jgi:transcriptional regulator with XRE-family HTH domain
MPRLNTKERGITGERLVELRLQISKSQQEVADEIALTRRNIGYYEEGKVKPPLDSLVKLARYYKVSTDYLLGVSG